MARGDRSARRAGAGAQREADRRARRRGRVRPGSGAGRGGRPRSRDDAAARAALLCGCRGADVPRRWARAAGSGAGGAQRPRAPAPRAGQPGPLPLVPAAVIAFIGVATGLGGFALAYRSTLIRSAADQAADRVPLDVRVSPGPDFKTPLEAAPLQRWQALASGAVLPIRRTEANYTSGGQTV